MECGIAVVNTPGEFVSFAYSLEFDRPRGTNATVVIGEHSVVMAGQKFCKTVVVACLHSSGSIDDNRANVALSVWLRIPVNVTTDSGNVTGNSGERDRWVGVARFNFMPSCFFG